LETHNHRLIKMSKDIITIFHNPRCSKSREALELLEGESCQVEVVEYLKKPPTYTQIKKLLAQLNVKPLDIVRTAEKLYKEKFKNKNFSDDEWVKILSENPILIERPIVVKNNKAIIGRPPKLIKDIL